MIEPSQHVRYMLHAGHMNAYITLKKINANTTLASQIIVTRFIVQLPTALA